MSRRDLSHKKILVTGASSGIGRSICLRLAGRGATLLATARRQERLESLAEQISAPAQFHFLAGDLNESLHRDSLVDWIGQNWGQLDGLINNAGAGAIGRFDEASSDRLRTVMEIDFFSPVELTRLCLPWLRKGNQPFILNIGSVLSHVSVPCKSEYCSAKFAFRGWSESIRVELAAQGISVLMLSPSTTKTEFFDSLVDTSPSSKSQSVGQMTSDEVALQAIRSMERSRRDAILSWGGKSLVLLRRFCPSLLEYVLRRYGQ